MKNKGFNKYLIAIVLLVIIAIIVVLIINLNKKSNSINNNVKEELNLKNEVAKILENERAKQKDSNINISFNDLTVDKDKNSFFTFNCSQKLDFQKQQGIILDLANSFFNELPDVYGKNTIYENIPEIKITSGANCMYREGWKIYKGYLGTMLV